MPIRLQSNKVRTMEPVQDDGALDFTAAHALTAAIVGCPMGRLCSMTWPSSLASKPAFQSIGS